MDKPDLYMGLYHENLNIAERVWGDLDLAASRAGYQFPRTWISRSELLPRGLMTEQEAIPKDALLLVHGDFSAGYNNVGKAYQLQEQRTDLRFIILVDGDHCSETYFASGKDYCLVKEWLAQEFHPRHRIGVSPINVVDFVHPTSSREQQDYCLEQYLRAWRLSGE